MMKSSNENKRALIFGVTGQDGSYLSEYLLKEGYLVIGVKRRCSTSNTQNLEEDGASLLNDEDFILVEGDITDYASVSGVLRSYQPHEIYNLAAQSHVGTSFKQPLATWNSTACGVLNILEVMRQEGHIERGARFYQASSSEMFGSNYIYADGLKTQCETVPFSPQSPYAVAKVAAHNLVGLYRKAYGLFGCCGILFNHESPRRGENFVTRKITKYVARLYKGLTEPNEKLQLGNLEAYRDWGHASDYVRAMHLMLTGQEPDDYVIATGDAYTVKEFCVAAFSSVGFDYREHIAINPLFYRPAEVDYLRGNATKALEKLNWKPSISFFKLVDEMVEADIKRL